MDGMRGPDMNRYPRYLWVVVGYMAALIAVSTFVTMDVCGLSATDSFYFVVQTLWTVGYGDVIPPGDEGRLISICVILFGTVGITSALGIVGGMILDGHTRRHTRLEGEVSETRQRNLEALYRWGERRGISRERIDSVLEEIRDEQR